MFRKKNRRFIYTSTVLTYDFFSHKKLNETSLPNNSPSDAYVHSKRLADIEVDLGVAAGLDAVFLHPSAVFGAYDKVTWSKMFMEIERGLPLPFAPPGGGSVCHARKVVQAHLAAYDRGGRGEHYILGGPDESWLNVAIQIAKILNRPPPKCRLPAPLFKLYGNSEYFISRLLKRIPMLDPHSTSILCYHVFSDSSKAIRDLGYDPSSLEEMLQDCFQWMVATGMIKR